MSDLTPARPVQWSTFGVAVFDQHTTSEAIVAAGLDWTVDLKPVFQMKQDGTFSALPKRYGVTRSTDELVLGIVGEKYTPYQNLDAFTFFDPIVESGLATLDTADELQDGKVVWLTAKFNEAIQVGDMPEEQVDMYVLLRTSHDGSKSISVDITPVRLMCSNTLNLAMRSSKRTWKVNHTGSLHERMSEAREVIENLGAYSVEFKATANQLLETELTLAGFESLVTALLPAEGDAPRRGKLVEHHAHTQTLTDEVRATGWGAVNSIGEFYQHQRNFRSGDRALDQDWFGSSVQIRDRATRLLLTNR